MQTEKKKGGEEEGRGREGTNENHIVNPI